MKNFTIVIVFFLFLNYTHAQIFDTSFEEWEEILYPPLPGTSSYLYENPIGWDVNQNSGLERVQKSTQTTEGDYALKIIPSTINAFNGCSSILIKSVNLDNPVGESLSLFFDYKAISNNSNGDVYFEISLDFYQNNNFLGNNVWINNEEIQDYNRIEIPLIVNADYIIITIKGGAIGNYLDTCVKESFSWVDNLKIESSILDVNSNTKNNLVLYPNPVFDKFKIVTKEIPQIKSIIIYPLCIIISQKKLSIFL